MFRAVKPSPNCYERPRATLLLEKLPESFLDPRRSGGCLRQRAPPWPSRRGLAALGGRHRVNGRPVLPCRALPCCAAEAAESRNHPYPAPPRPPWTGVEPPHRRVRAAGPGWARLGALCVLAGGRCVVGGEELIAASGKRARERG